MISIETKFGKMFFEFNNDDIYFYDESEKFISSVDQYSYLFVNNLEELTPQTMIETINKSGNFRDFLFGIGLDGENYNYTLFDTPEEMYKHIYDIDINFDYNQIQVVNLLLEMIEKETLESEVLSWEYGRKIGDRLFCVEDF